MVFEDSFLEERLLAQNVYEFFILKDTAKLEWRPFSCEGALPGAEPEMKDTLGGKNMGFSSPWSGSNQSLHVQVQVMALPSSFCVILDNSLHLSELLFPSLQSVGS